PEQEESQKIKEPPRTTALQIDIKRKDERQDENSPRAQKDPQRSPKTSSKNLKPPLRLAVFAPLFRSRIAPDHGLRHNAAHRGGTPGVPRSRRRPLPPRLPCRLSRRCDHRVARAGAGVRSGLHAGDVLVSWERGDAAGTLRSCADLAAAETEEAPRGPVILH